MLAAIYAAFAEGWSDAGQRNLTDEAIWLGRLVAVLLPGEPEALGLLALMLHAEARRAARRDRGRRLCAIGGAGPGVVGCGDDRRGRSTAGARQRDGVILGRYQLEAAVQSAHAARRLTGHTDWVAIERLYEALSAITNSPVVAINRAVAIAEVQGAPAGLANLDALAADQRLAEYQPYWAARAELLARAGNVGAAEHAYQRAIGLASDPAVRAFLQGRRESSV